MALVVRIPDEMVPELRALVIRSLSRLPGVTRAHGALVVPGMAPAKYQAARNAVIKLLYHAVKGSGMRGPDAYDSLESRMVRGGELRFEVDGVAVYPRATNTRGVPRLLGSPPAAAAASAEAALAYAWRLLWLKSGAAAVEERPVILYLAPGMLDQARVHGRSRGLLQDVFYCCAVVWWQRGSLRGYVAPDRATDGWALQALRVGSVQVPGMADVVGTVDAETPTPTVGHGVSYDMSIPQAAVFVENPLGMLRSRPFMQRHADCMQIIDYCCYGALWQKSTCIWAWGPDSFTWEGRARCRFDCHSCELGGGTHVNTIGGDQSHAREEKYVVPSALCAECTGSMLGLPGCAEVWVLDLCCGPNRWVWCHGGGRAADAAGVSRARPRMPPRSSTS